MWHNWDAVSVEHNWSIESYQSEDNEYSQFDWIDINWCKNISTIWTLLDISIRCYDHNIYTQYIWALRKISIWPIQFHSIQFNSIESLTKWSIDCDCSRTYSILSKTQSLKGYTYAHFLALPPLISHKLMIKLIDKSACWFYTPCANTFDIDHYCDFEGNYWCE